MYRDLKTKLLVNGDEAEIGLFCIPMDACPAVKIEHQRAIGILLQAVITESLGNTSYRAVQHFILRTACQTEDVHSDFRRHYVEGLGFEWTVAGMNIVLGGVCLQ
ncbi:hypothetical protein Tco_0813047 [Tanacetum coccineum]